MADHLPSRRTPRPGRPGRGVRLGCRATPAAPPSCCTRGTEPPCSATHGTCSARDAEDASQATFLAVHRALSAGTAVLSPRRVLGIARNECLGRCVDTHCRTRPRSKLSRHRLRRTERRAESAQIRVAHDTLRALPVPEREAFVLRVARPAHGRGRARDEPDVRRDREPHGPARRSLVLAVGGLGRPQAAPTRARASRQARSGRRRRCTCCAVPCAAACDGPSGLRAESDARAPIEVVGSGSPGAPGFASGGGGIVALLTAKAAAAPLRRRPPRS